MEEYRRISGEPEVARGKDYKGNAAISMRKRNIPHFRCSTLAEVESQ